MEFLNNKNIAILGFGLEGKSTYEFIRKNNHDIHLTIIDRYEVKGINDKNVKIIYGEDYLNDLDKYDIIMKTPGISLKDIDITLFKDKIYSQLELLLMVNRKNVIGITGTKGKSTTSTLIYNIIKEQNDNVYLAGNIGIPIFDLLEEFDEDSLLVIEMSSHQLEFVHHSPHIGIILNLYEDHLDHAGTIEHYHECKMHMFDYQREDDIAIYCSDNPNLLEQIKIKDYRQTLYSVSLDNNSDVIRKDNQVIYNNEVIYLDDNKRNLIGEPNLKNIMVVSLVSKLLKLDLNKVKETIDSFAGLEHRLELVGTFDEVTYYNDTIATIPEATISGIESLKKVNTLIFGGMDRGIDYSSFIDYLKNSSIENLICMPTTGTKIGKVLKTSNKNIYFVTSLEEAVLLAKKVTKKKSICLLSPAASSYETFKNFVEKGNKYKELVKAEELN